MIDLLKDKFIISLILLTLLLTFIQLSNRAATMQPKIPKSKVLQSCVEKVCVLRNDQITECITFNDIYLAEVFEQIASVKGSPNLIYVELKKKCNSLKEANIRGD